jgi:hypothetical protein
LSLLLVSSDKLSVVRSGRTESRYERPENNVKKKLIQSGVSGLRMR